MFHILLFVFLAASTNLSGSEHPAGTFLGKAKGNVGYDSKEECVSHLEDTSHQIMALFDSKNIKVNLVGDCFPKDQIDKVEPPEAPAAAPSHAPEKL